MMIGWFTHDGEKEEERDGKKKMNEGRKNTIRAVALASRCFGMCNGKERTK